MTIAKAKAAWPIEAVVGRYVRLKPHGTYLTGRCPFHDDRHPSLAVFPRTGRFVCYACGARGDAVDFVARIERVGLAEAARRLAGGAAAAPSPAAPPHDPEPADPSRRDRVYRALIDVLELTPEHRAALLARGLSPEAVEWNGYRSLPPGGRSEIAKKLMDREHDLTGVPGFALSRGRWRLFGPPGLLVPVRDVEGRIVGCQVRSDRSERGRYRWLSTPPTARRSGGASSGSPCHVAGPRERGEILFVTEGPLKADVAADRLRHAVVGVAGVANWRKAVPVVEALRPSLAVVAFDRDESPSTRRAVAAAASDLRRALEAAGVRTAEARWEGAKGIDDALLSGQEIRIVF